ncbi:hypothetical protein ACFX2B_043550 [Malus domestica]
MVKDVATYFFIALGAFVFWQSMDEVHVWTKSMWASQLSEFSFQLGILLVERDSERKGNQNRIQCLRVRASNHYIVISVAESERRNPRSSPMAKKSVAQRRLTKLDVYLYLPNMIGYVRVLMNCFAFAQCFSNKQLFSVLYFVSFVCDGVDGWCARKFNQESLDYEHSLILGWYEKN